MDYSLLQDNVQNLVTDDDMISDMATSNFGSSDGKLIRVYKNNRE